MRFAPLDRALFIRSKLVAFLWEFLMWRQRFDAQQRWCSHILLSLWTLYAALVREVSVWLFPWQSLSVLVRRFMEELRLRESDEENKCSKSHLDPSSLWSCSGSLVLSPVLYLWRWVSDKGWVEAKTQKRIGKTWWDLVGSNERTPRCRERWARPKRTSRSRSSSPSPRKPESPGCGPCAASGVLWDVARGKTGTGRAWKGGRGEDSGRQVVAEGAEELIWAPPLPGTGDPVGSTGTGKLPGRKGGHWWILATQRVLSWRSPTGRHTLLEVAPSKGGYVNLLLSANTECSSWWALRKSPARRAAERRRAATARADRRERIHTPPLPAAAEKPGWGRGRGRKAHMCERSRAKAASRRRGRTSCSRRTARLPESAAARSPRTQTPRPTPSPGSQTPPPSGRRGRQTLPEWERPRRPGSPCTCPSAGWSPPCRPRWSGAARGSWGSWKGTGAERSSPGGTPRRWTTGRLEPASCPAENHRDRKDLQGDNPPAVHQKQSKPKSKHSI